MRWILTRYIHTQSKQSPLHHKGNPVPELIPIMKVLYSARIDEEHKNIVCPLYRKEREQTVQLESMSKHRTYVRKLLALHTDYDEVQEWLLQLVGLLYRRLDNSSTGLRENKLIRIQTLPECTDDELRLYRESVVKLLS